jgi:cysteine desulfurase/selenocysteine lyase
MILHGKIKNHINAKLSHEVLFTPGTTLNQFSCKWIFLYFKKLVIVLVSALEHHSNIVPWQMLCEKQAPHSKSFHEWWELIMAEYEIVIIRKTKMLRIIFQMHWHNQPNQV